MLRNLPLALWLALAGTAAAADAPARPISALFLGDRGHHKPADLVAQVGPVLASRGVEITYTESLADINPANLSKYDALILYANIDAITPEAEHALLGYVEGGGGFVPLHCASFCFRNSPAFVALVGAQFKSHGTGEFDTAVADAADPIMRGLTPFRTWDETYVHAMHNPEGRHVLQTRDEGAKSEPWTWTRTQGKGRVFYTAYGHDPRTWGNPGFVDLIERGIRWAAHKGEVFDSRPRVAPGLPAFAYDTDAAKIPIYIPAAKWGVQAEPSRKMQRPLPPAESARHLALPKGFEAKLYVSEPQIYKPIAVNWDHRGRLWVSETLDYPNELMPPGKGRDQIKVVEDTDGDGTPDKFTVFADNLSIPTSLCFADGGVIVHQAPDTLFLKDTDGDGRADVRKVLFTGWNTADTHAGPSNLRVGLDNWIYGMVGYSGFRGKVGGASHQFRQGLYRFKADGSAMEFLRSTNNNSWGVGFSEEGYLFGSTANGCPSVYAPIANRFYEGVKGWSSAVLANIADSDRMFPATDKVRQVDYFGRFTAGAGHALYTARLLPREYWNRAAFVNEPTGHIVATFNIVPRGTDFASHNGWNLVASDDEWTSPISAEVGPDGCVWVTDWYNFIVQHNPTPEGFSTGKGSAYETPLRDKTHGRIYRVMPSGANVPKIVPLDPSKPQTLVTALKSDNMFWRVHAQRLMVDAGDLSVVPALIALVGDRGVDAIGLNPAAIHALWTLHGLKQLDGTNAAATAAATAALGHPSAGVRRNALLVVDRGAKDVVAEVGKRLEDGDPQVRLAALLVLSEMPYSDAAGALVARAVADGRLDGDRWLGDAATAAAARHDRAYLTAISTMTLADRGPLAATISARVAEHYARGGPADSVGAVLAALSKADRRVADAIVGGLAKGWPKGKPATLDAAAETSMVGLAKDLGSTARTQLVGLAEGWGSRAFEARAAEIVGALMADVQDAAKADDARIFAARQLVDFRRRDGRAAADLLALVTPRTSPALAAGLIDAVALSESPEAGAALAQALPRLTPGAKPVALKALLGRAEWTKALLDAAGADKVRLSELALDQQQALAAHPDPAIAGRAKSMLGKGGGLPDADRQKVIEEVSAVALGAGDASIGKSVFTQNCAKCHRHNGEGGKVGPDLSGMNTHPKAELLIHILDPSRSVEGNYVQYSLATTDGRVLAGLLAAESKTTVELLDAEGKKSTVLRDEIEEFAASKKSLMPEGFEKLIPAKSLADLLEFLTSKGKFLPLDLRKVATVASDKGMFSDREGDIERLVFDDWSPKTFQGVPFALVDPEGGRVNNAVLLYGPNGKIPPSMPRSVRLPCNATAKAIHLLSGVSGWGATGTGGRKTVSMIVRLHYADGQTEDHPLRDGEHFADYIRVVDVPGSTLAFKLRGQQIRYLAVEPKRRATIEAVELVKGPDATAPIVMAVTVETPE